MARNVIIAVFIILSLLLLYFLLKPKPVKDENISTPPITNAPVEAPPTLISRRELIEEVGYPSGLKVDILDKDCFVIGYHELAEQAAWTMYQMDPKQPKLKIKRDNNFFDDKLIETGSASAKDYRKSGYDRGHLVPAGDMKVSENCYLNTFLLSNISPQNHEFNTGIWKRIEEKTRKWSKNGKLVVITGGVIKSGLKTIGKNDVAVPEAYYKIIYRPAPVSSAIAFLCPNKDSKLSIEKFVVSIDKVEKETGLDFLPRLSDEMENKLEADIPIRQWF